MATISAPTYVPNQLYQIPLPPLQSDPAQPKKYLDPAALDELTASIAQHGVLEPILFRQEAETTGTCTGSPQGSDGDMLRKPEGTETCPRIADGTTLYIIAGERRCAAARKAGLTTIPGICLDTPNPTEYAIIENIVRQDLNPIEEGEAYDALIKGKNYTQEDLAKIIGKSAVTISEAVSLTNLPQSIRDECRQDPIVSKKELVKIARKKQERGMFTAYRQYREAQAKAATPTVRTTTKRTPAEALMAAFEDAGKKIEALDLKTLSANELTSVLEMMTRMKNFLEQTLAKAPQPKKKAT
ncbi:MAG: ParB/RepB/Spo0J family partition protein [Syntrophales bacterium]|nr:ParB/RepB/Spo0J family partition protein [Syntrophales bacterium]